MLCYVRRCFSVLLKNRDIKVARLLIIDEAGVKHGPMQNADAMRFYDQEKADLVLVNARHDPPIAKIIPISVQLQRKAAMETNAMIQRMRVREKEIHFGTNIAIHDYETRLDRIIWLMERAMRVKIVIETRGKQQRDPLGKEKLLQKIQLALMEKFAKDLQIIQAPRLENSQLFMVVTSASAVPPKQQQQQQQEEEEEETDE